METIGIKADTGHTQRKPVKAMEDCKTQSAQTVRNAQGAIVQFLYGEDGIEGTKVENLNIPYLRDGISQEELEKLYLLPEAKEHFAQLMEDRDFLINHVFRGELNSAVSYCIPFHRLVNKAKRSMEVDPTVPRTPLKASYVLNTMEQLIQELFITPQKRQSSHHAQILLRAFLSPKPLMDYGISLEAFDWIISEVKRHFKEAIAPAGEMVGVVAAQSIGEICTQLSCLGSTIIRVRNKQDPTKSYTGPMAAFIDSLLAANPASVIDIGHDSVVMDLLEDWEIVGVSEQEKTSWRRISQISRHPANGGMVRIYTRSGRTTCATLSHSFLKRSTNGIVPVKGSELNIGDRVPVAKKIPIPEDTLQEMEGFQLTKDFGWFVGMYLADGSLNGNYVIISKTLSEVENRIRALGRTWNMPYKCASDIRKDPFGNGKDYTTTSHSLYSSPLAKFLRTQFKTGSYEKRVPGWVYAANSEFVAGLLGGYFDGDGNVQCTGGRQQIRAHSVNEGLVDDILVLLNYMGVYGSKCMELRDREVSNVFHTIQIGRKYARTFRDNIGLMVNTKADALEQIVKYVDNAGDRHHEADYIDKVPEVSDLVSYIGKRLDFPDQSRRYGHYARNKVESIGRTVLQNYIRVFEESNKTKNFPDVEHAISLLRQGVESDVIYDQITKIEYLDDPNEFVYDFTVPGNDSFMVDTAVLVHNTLNTFHLAGISSAANVTRGVPRLKEVLNVTKNLKSPSLAIHLSEGKSGSEDHAKEVMRSLEITRLQDVVTLSEICYDPPGEDGYDTGIPEDQSFLNAYRRFSAVDPAHDEDARPRSPWVLRLKLDHAKLLEHNLTMMDIYQKINNQYYDRAECVFTDDNANDLIFRIRMHESDDVSVDDTTTALKALETNLLHNILLKGIQGIKKTMLRKVTKKMYDPSVKKHTSQEAYIIDTNGTNLLEILGNPYVDSRRTISNDIVEVYETLGIEAARNCLYHEIQEVMSSSSVNYRHLSLLIDVMTNRGTLMSIDRHGLNRGDAGPFTKSSFEESTDILINAGVFAEKDNITGVSPSIILGQLAPCGTGSSDIILDEQMLIEQHSAPAPAPQEPSGPFYQQEVLESCDIPASGVYSYTVPPPSNQPGLMTLPTIHEITIV